jgi:hypothetical protein
MNTPKKGADTIRLEEYTDTIQGGLITVWQAPDSVNAWLPTEFLLGQYITRILIVGRTSPVSLSLAADPSWTQVWRVPGAKEWSCLLGVLAHMPGPALIVVGPDVALSPKVVTSLKEEKGATSIVIRVPGPQSGGFVGSEPTHVFFPVLSQQGPLLQIAQEWTAKAVPKGLDLKAVLPQLTAAGYGLAIAAGVWHWYRPADSPPMASLTVAQVARQLQILGATMERMVV